MTQSERTSGSGEIRFPGGFCLSDAAEEFLNKDDVREAIVERGNKGGFSKSNCDMGSTHIDRNGYAFVLLVHPGTTIVHVELLTEL